MEMQRCGSCSALSGGGTCDRDACKIYVKKLLFVGGFEVVALFKGQVTLGQKNTTKDST